ncbi:MAG: hypothetical protein E6Q97_17750 [Desulfurellales bacterium]|nr:MAG: hypothetical protein E6Q97_17750 [Desulfurellales bacterium]
MTEWSPNYISLPAAAIYVATGDRGRTQSIEDMTASGSRKKVLAASKMLASVEDVWPMLEKAIGSGKLVAEAQSLVWPRDDTTPSTRLPCRPIRPTAIAGARIVFDAPTMDGEYAVQAAHEYTGDDLYWYGMRFRASEVFELRRAAK